MGKMKILQLMSAIKLLKSSLSDFDLVYVHEPLLRNSNVIPGVPPSCNLMAHGTSPIVGTYIRSMDTKYVTKFCTKNVMQLDDAHVLTFINLYVSLLKKGSGEGLLEELQWYLDMIRNQDVITVGDFSAVPFGTKETTTEDL